MTLSPQKMSFRSEAVYQLVWDIPVWRNLIAIQFILTAGRSGRFIMMSGQLKSTNYRRSLTQSCWTGKSRARALGILSKTHRSCWAWVDPLSGQFTEPKLRVTLIIPCFFQVTVPMGISLMDGQFKLVIWVFKMVRPTPEHGYPKVSGYWIDWKFPQLRLIKLKKMEKSQEMISHYCWAERAGGSSNN